MSTRWQISICTLVPAALLLAIGCLAGAQSNTDSRSVPAVRDEERAASPHSVNPSEVASRLEELKSTLRDRSSLKRVQAVEEIDASVTIDSATAENLLREAVDDQDARVAEASFRALVRRSTEQLQLVPESEAKKYPGPTGELAKVHFAAIHQDTAALGELMRNGDALVQEAAFEAWASRDTNAAIEGLKAELQDVMSLHRLETLELVIRSPYTNSHVTLMPILELASEDRDPRVQERAKQVLAQIRAENQQ